MARYTAYIVENRMIKQIGEASTFERFIDMFVPYFDQDVRFRAADALCVREVRKEEIMDIWNSLKDRKQEVPAGERFTMICEKIKKQTGYKPKEKPNWIKM